MVRLRGSVELPLLQEGSGLRLDLTLWTGRQRHGRG